VRSLCALLVPCSRATCQADGASRGLITKGIDVGSDDIQFNRDEQGSDRSGCEFDKKTDDVDWHHRTSSFPSSQATFGPILRKDPAVPIPIGEPVVAVAFDQPQKLLEQFSGHSTSAI
jgi:hypothetical protein